jgi:pyruvate formate lyase activating enzyme
MRKLAALWEEYGDKEKKVVKCKICAHYCIIAPEMRGICKTRENFDGKLYSLVYNSCISRGSVDPVEKKPLYHFWPGSEAFSIATVGCNFHCKHCQNWEISQSSPDIDGNIAHFSQKDRDQLGARSFPLTVMSPEQVIKRTLRSGSKSIAYTYNEPTIWFEFIRDTALLAHKSDIKNILVTNGYSSIESNQEYIKFIDAANIDIKSFSNEFYKKIVGVPSLQPVLETAMFFKQNGIHLELTYLIIPTKNDSLEEITKMVDWMVANLGVDIPLHFSAYRPMYRLNQPQTSSQILFSAYEIAKKAGLHYVFIGNLVSDKGGNTYCPNCEELIIQRHGYHILNKNLTKNNTCKICGSEVLIKGEFN